MKKYIKFFLLLFIVLYELTSSTLVVSAADQRLGGFKCSTFAPENKKLAIFKISRDELTTGDPYFDPKNGEFFCVEVAEGINYAQWVELIEGKNASGQLVIQREWNNKEVRAQFRDKCPNASGEWDDIDSDYRPSLGRYEFSLFISHPCAITGRYNARQRYYFNNLGSPVDEVFVYFIKIADDDDQQPNPIPLCAQKNSTSKQTCEADSQCLWQVAGAKCLAKADTSIDCAQLPSDVCLAARHCTAGENNTCVKKTVKVELNKAIDNYIAERNKKPDGYTGPLPDCAFTGTCRNVEDLVQLGVNIANWLFGIIAGLGFAFFVYGGLTMVLSFGNSEKVGQGKQILVAAAVGMIIAFSAYILVDFIVEAIGINPNLVPF